KPVGGSIPASARISSISTPSHGMFSFDQLVTQWISRVIFVLGNELNSLQVQLAIGRGPFFRAKDHFSSETLGVGPADKTGKSSTRCCPGGIRPASSFGGCFPMKPRVTIYRSSKVDVEHLRSKRRRKAICVAKP